MPSRIPPKDQSVPLRARFSLRLSFLLTALVLVGVPDAVAATPLLPDLKTLPPRSLLLENHVNVTLNPEDAPVYHNVLRFSNTTWNAGPGRLEIHGTVDPTHQNVYSDAYQRIRNTDGTTTEVKVGQFFWHQQHRHYHFDGWGRYELWTKEAWDRYIASGRDASAAQPLYHGQKTTACALDEEFIETRSGTPASPVYSGKGCLENDQTGATTISEGLSVGWGDTYDYYRFEQWIDLGAGHLADGDYVLQSIANPGAKLVEAPGTGGEQQNEGVETISIRNGALVDRDDPTGSVVINGVASSTSSPTVKLSLVGRDDVSGVDRYRVSNSPTGPWYECDYWNGNGSGDPVCPTGGTKASPSNFVRIPQWDLTDARYGGSTTGGLRQVYVAFKDVSGNWGAPVSDTIEYTGGTGGTTGGPSAYAAAVAADAPVGYWRLADASTSSTATPSAGSLAGTYSGGVTRVAVGLPANEGANAARTFDGRTGLVRVPDSADHALAPTASVSVEAWIRPTSIPAPGARATIVAKEGSYALRLSGSQLEFVVLQNGNGTRRSVLAPVNAIRVGETYHVVGTYDGSRERLYIDGALAAEKPLTGAIDAPAGVLPLRIGSFNGSVGSVSGDFFAGAIDEVAVYPTGLGVDRIGVHAGEGGTYDHPVVLSVAIAAGGSGRVTSTPFGIDCGSTCTAGFPRSTHVLLRVEPAPGMTFSGWQSGAGYGYCAAVSDATCEVVTDVDTTLVAVFSPTTAPPPPGGDPGRPPGPPGVVTVAAPTRLVATVNGSAVRLTWQDRATNEVGYQVDRSRSASFSGVTSVALPANAVSYTDRRLASGTWYYRVRALAGFSTSDFSSTVAARVPRVLAAAGTLSTPRRLHGRLVQLRGGLRVDLRWTAVAPRGVRFVVQRSTDGRRWKTLAARLPFRTRSFVDRLHVRGRYQYRVRAMRATSRSPWSNRVLVRLR